jgi:hypothetical protein
LTTSLDLLDLNLSIRALNAVISEEELDDEEKEALTKIRNVIRETLIELNASDNVQ